MYWIPLPACMVGLGAVLLYIDDKVEILAVRDDMPVMGVIADMCSMRGGGPHSGFSDNPVYTHLQVATPHTTTLLTTINNNIPLSQLPSSLPACMHTSQYICYFLLCILI